MPSTPHTAVQRTAMQAERTALLSTTPTFAAAGNSAVAAAQADRARELKEVHDTENAPLKLS